MVGEADISDAPFQEILDILNVIIIDYFYLPGLGRGGGGGWGMGGNQLGGYFAPPQYNTLICIHTGSYRGRGEGGG